MSSAVEARFRIDRPNSRPRTVKVIALDRQSEPLVRDLAEQRWNAASFFAAADSTGTPPEMQQEGVFLHDLSGLPVPLAPALEGAGLVVMVATVGEDAPAVAPIGRACSDARVSTTGLILGDVEYSDEALSKTLAQLRPWMLMLVVARSNDYVEDMLHALRA